MPKKMVLRARAKINLGLRVLGKRKDGFHEIETVLQQISLADTLVLSPAASGKLHFFCTEQSLAGPDNLVLKAACLLKQASAKKLPGVKIALYKNIPQAAGLAGGSSDAAAALYGLNKFWQLGLSQAKLLRLAAKLGSDVPFCLLGGTMLARGRGEVLEALPPLPFFWVSLVLPLNSTVSTAEAYAKLSPALMGKPSLKELLQAVEAQNKTAILKWSQKELVNTLESAELEATEKIKYLQGAYRCLGLPLSLSGSGPTLFLITESFKTATWAAGLAGALGAKAWLCWTHNDVRWC